MPTRMSEERELEIVRLYGEGHSMQDVARMVGCNPDTCSSALRRRGVAARRGVEIGAADLSLARQAYKEGQKLDDVATALGVSRGTLKKRFLGVGVKIRKTPVGKRAYHLNESAFDDATVNPGAAYWVGLLFADGCITYKHMRRHSHAILSIGLSGDDGKHLENLRAFLGAGHPLSVVDAPGGYASRTPLVRLTIHCGRIAESLARFGVEPRKSTTAVVRGGMEGNRHFWRGMMDGDGWLSIGDSKQHPMCGLTGSRRSMEQFSDCVYTAIGSRFSLVPNHSIWAVTIRQRAALRLIHHLYQDGDIALPRKMQIAAAVKSRFSESSWRVCRDWSHLTVASLTAMKEQMATWAAVARSLKIRSSDLCLIRRRLGMIPGRQDKCQQ